MIAFRGTTDVFQDYLFGNLYWFLEDVVEDDQYEKAVELLQRVLTHYGGQDILIRTVGHSLGGGLAQHALYAKPERVSQAVVFHPSPVTGFSRYDDRDRNCVGGTPPGIMQGGAGASRRSPYLSDLRIGRGLGVLAFSVQDS